ARLARRLFGGRIAPRDPAHAEMADLEVGDLQRTDLAPPEPQGPHRQPADRHRPDRERAESEGPEGQRAHPPRADQPVAQDDPLDAPVGGLERAVVEAHDGAPDQMMPRLARSAMPAAS